MKLCLFVCSKEVKVYWNDNFFIFIWAVLPWIISFTHPFICVIWISSFPYNAFNYPKSFTGPEASTLQGASLSESARNLIKIENNCFPQLPAFIADNYHQLFLLLNFFCQYYSSKFIYFGYKYRISRLL